jgi:membrane peptidoglycan carboxypeptidase
VLTALMIIGPFVGFFVAYQMVEVPKPEDVAAKQRQVVSLTYANGDPLSKIVPPGGSRTMVTYDELPDVVKHAVYAAEDAGFETNPGFDISGVLGAAWNQVSGGVGGGSTITQQYIKKATGNDEASGLGGITRKATEVVKAYKMNNTYDKHEIITAYLNTIYFGRGANGIVAAAQAYYGKELKALTPSEAALLAGMIQRPSQDDDTDPVDNAYMHRRWNYVIGQMAQKNWLSDAGRKAAAFPTLIARDASRPQAITGPKAHIQTAVLAEVKKETGMDLETLQHKGYTIKTTIDPTAQGLAEAAVQKVTDGQPANWLPAMTAVNPKTGEIIAYYGGKDGNGIDWAKQRQEPGSSFKPFDLVALLEKGLETGQDFGLGTTYDGTSPRKFGDDPNSKPIRNAGNDSCGKECTVALAMKKSINTVFYDIALNTVGTQNVADAAHQAGIKAPLVGSTGGAPDGNIAIGGGTTQVSTVEMASAYGTFAANGIYRAPHLVKEILTPDGGVVWQPDQASLNGKPAFDASNSSTNQKIARNVTEALLPIADYSNVPCAAKRPCASKSGTHQLGDTAENAKAWYVGYTPQISVAVALGAEENNKVVAVKDKGGVNISGAKGPGKIWQEFMNTYLNGQPVENFSKFVPIGKKVGDADEDGGKQDGKPSENGKPSSNNGSGQNSQTPPSEPDDPTTTTDPVRAAAAP